MKLEYTRVGDYFFPNLILPEEKRPIGHWGMIRKTYLKDYKKAWYQSMLLSGELGTHLADIHEQAIERFEYIEAQLMEAEGVTEELKASDQMLWVRKRNNIRHRVEEIIKNELIYV
ncbi:MAG: TnpV protein [Clostridia bacterium]|nr:TnpV protein [Clostridia bacterium]